MKKKKYPYVWVTRDEEFASWSPNIEIWAPQDKPTCVGGYWGKSSKSSLLDLCPEEFEAVMHWLPPLGTRWKMRIYFDAEEE